MDAAFRPVDVAVRKGPVAAMEPPPLSALPDICIYESRPRDEVAVKLLVLSISRHEPGARMHVFVENLGDGLKAWLGARPNVVV